MMLTSSRLSSLAVLTVTSLACTSLSASAATEKKAAAAQPVDAKEQARLARAEVLGKEWADKMIKPHLAGKPPGLSEAEQKRVLAEFRTLAAPKNVDAAALRKNIVGHWTSPRHDYTYKANGHWTMTDGGTTGTWEIKGNKFLSDGENPETIITISPKYFIYFDAQSVYFLFR